MFLLFFFYFTEDSIFCTQLCTLLDLKMDSGDHSIYKMLSHSFYSCVIFQYVCKIFYLSSLLGYVVGFPSFAMTKHIAHFSFHLCTNISVEYIPRSEIAGSKGVSICSLRDKLCVAIVTVLVGFVFLF